MIPSRKILVVVLAALGATAFAVAAGAWGGAPGRGAGDAPSAAQDAGEAATGQQDAAAQAAADAEAAGPQQAQEAEPARRLLPVREYEPAGLTAQEAIDAHAAATEGPEQPIPFNHRFHVRDIGLQCAYCHGGVQESAVAPIPAVEVCMGCHLIVGQQLEAVQLLKTFWDDEEPIPWERVYKVPDFVQFPHDAHIRNDLECAECHGPVEDMDRVYPVTDLRMGWCLECHMGEGVDTDYATDRLLAEEFAPPLLPEDRQPVGLYPRMIDQRYGASRAPIDCTACHY